MNNDGSKGGKWSALPYTSMEEALSFIQTLRTAASECQHEPVAIDSTDHRHPLAVHPICRRCCQEIEWRASISRFVAKTEDPYKPGAPCTVNASGDMALMCEARPFFNAPCVIVKRTKAGLIQVALAVDLRRTYSFPQRNVDL